MRFYSIIISEPGGGLIRPPGFSASLGNATYTNYVNGQIIQAGWKVELDIQAFPFAQPSTGSWARVWGVSLEQIAQASDLNGKNIQVWGGFKKGLPLANPEQSGLLIEGMIYQSFANWIGTDQTLELIMMPGSASGGESTGGTGTKQSPKNIVLKWAKNSSLGEALQTALTTAFPGYEFDVSINSNIILPNDETTVYYSVGQLAEYAQTISRNIIKEENYRGVQIALTGKKFKIYDGTTPPQQTDILFQDLIGQPTWIEPPLIQFKCPMRADLSVGDVVSLPKTRVINSARSLSSLVNQNVSFQGKFEIQTVRHSGDSRQPTGDAWVSIFNAYPVTA